MHRQRSLLTAAHLAGDAPDPGLGSRQAANPTTRRANRQGLPGQRSHKEFWWRASASVPRLRPTAPPANECNAGKCAPSPATARATRSCPRQHGVHREQVSGLQDDKECPGGHCVKARASAKKPCKNRGRLRAGTRTASRASARRRRRPRRRPPNGRLEIAGLSGLQRVRRSRSEAHGDAGATTSTASEGGARSPPHGPTPTRRRHAGVKPGALRAAAPKSVRESLGAWEADGTKLTSCPRGVGREGDR